jgi:hypothetical protein
LGMAILESLPAREGKCVNLTSGDPNTFTFRVWK